MSSIAYITDQKMIEFHRLNGNQTMNFWRLSNAKKFTDFETGDLLFFLAKGSERGRRGEKGIVGYGRFQKSNILSLNQMWNLYGAENGYSSKQELVEVISKVTKDRKIPKQMNCLYLDNVVFFSYPVYLSEIGIQVSNNVESYIYLDKEDPQATEKLLNKAREMGVDLWSTAINDAEEDRSVFVEEQIKHRIAWIARKFKDSFYTDAEKRKLRKLCKTMTAEMAEQKIGIEPVKGNPMVLVRIDLPLVELFIPFVYTNKDFNRKLQALTGILWFYRYYLQDQPEIELHFNVLTEGKRPALLQETVQAMECPEQVRREEM